MVGTAHNFAMDIGLFTIIIHDVCKMYTYKNIHNANSKCIYHSLNTLCDFGNGPLLRLKPIGSLHFS